MSNSRRLIPRHSVRDDSNNYEFVQLEIPSGYTKYIEDESFLTVVMAIRKRPSLATIAEVQFASQECEQLLPILAFWDAST